MSDKVEISNINFKIGDKEIKLTLDEAKKLQGLLNSNFGNFITYPYYPPVIDKHIPFCPGPYWWQDWEITWSGTQMEDDRSGGTLYCSC